LERKKDKVKTILFFDEVNAIVEQHELGQFPFSRPPPAPLNRSSRFAAGTVTASCSTTA